MHDEKSRNTIKVNYFPLSVCEMLAAINLALIYARMSIDFCTVVHRGYFYRGKFMIHRTMPTLYAFSSPAVRVSSYNNKTQVIKM